MYKKEFFSLRTNDVCLQADIVTLDRDSKTISHISFLRRRVKIFRFNTGQLEPTTTLNYPNETWVTFTLTTLLILPVPVIVRFLAGLTECDWSNLRIYVCYRYTSMTETQFAHVSILNSRNQTLLFLWMFHKGFALVTMPDTSLLF